VSKDEFLAAREMRELSGPGARHLMPGSDEVKRLLRVLAQGGSAARGTPATAAAASPAAAVRPKKAETFIISTRIKAEEGLR
jgi:hypothetical protein